MAQGVMYVVFNKEKYYFIALTRELNLVESTVV